LKDPPNRMAKQIHQIFDKGCTSAHNLCALNTLSNLNQVRACVLSSKENQGCPQNKGQQLLFQSLNIFF